MVEPLHIIISDAQAKQRLDKALSAACDLSRSYLQQLLADGNIFINGAPVSSATTKVKAGQEYTIRIPEVTPLALEPVQMNLDILFEDAHMLVINKAAGITVHPAHSTKEATLVHGLLAHCGESLSGIGGVARPGIVHRLDKDTSGLIVVAKTDAAHQHLSAQLKDRSLSRTYEAVCWGTPQPPNGTIEGAIGRHPKDRIRMAVVERGGKEARTHYELLESFAVASHIRCKLESGRTHQIRVHLNHIGHGLVGDPVYGDSTANRLRKLHLDKQNPSETISVLANYRRQALHAAMIRFIHPVSGQEMQFKCALPEDVQLLLSSLRNLQKAT